MKETKLTDIRNEIDKLDEQIVQLLDARARAARAVRAAKEGTTVYRPGREAQVMRQAVRAGNGDMPADSLQAIYREVIAACRNMQQPLRVAYLGPEGTYSEEAARRQYGETSVYVPADSLDSVLHAVEHGEADVAVLPVENSTEGSVARTLDLLTQTTLYICGETTLPIHHQLLSNEKNLKAVAEVIAHPQALAQCRQWLDRHVPGASRTAAASNGEAARQAAQTAGTAAIAGRRAGTLYGLATLAANIEDDSANTTRFLTLGREKVTATRQDKTSMVCATPNRPGALHNVLAVLAAAGVNIVKLESRPAPGALWEYVFYIDIDGHQDDRAIAAVLGALREQTIFIKVLGSYPKGTK